MKKPTVDVVTMYLIASAASADPRTVRRFFDGQVVRPMIADRIETALRRLGYTNPRRSRKGGTKAA